MAARAPLAPANLGDGVAPHVESPTPPVRRNRSRYAGAALAVLSVLAAGYWLVNRLSHVHVTDARVAATMVAVSARTAGWIETIPVEEGDHVKRDQPLLIMDRREARLALAEANAQLEGLNAELLRIEAERELARATIASQAARARSEHAAAESGYAAAAADLTRAKAEWERATPLFEREIISREFWEQRRAEHAQAEAALEARRAEVAAAKAAIDEAVAKEKQLAVFDTQLHRTHVSIQEASAHRDRLAVALADREITSPSDGVVDDVFVDPGEYVNTGQHLMVIHDPSDVWVLANVKETDIRDVHKGSRAKVSVDAYPDRQFVGVIRRVGNAATSQFALLPNPNPSGNFTKITQRIEVRIDIEQDAELLKPGMMVEVEIDR
jgi:membrane fusion protein, multidrug efflux system